MKVTRGWVVLMARPSGSPRQLCMRSFHRSITTRGGGPRLNLRGAGRGGAAGGRQPQEELTRPPQAPLQAS